MTADERRRREEHERWVAALPENVRVAHKHSSRHRTEILSSNLCGCFYCLSTYAPSAIDEWTDSDSTGVGTTAICPYCSVDSVLGDSSGFPITKEFLSELKKQWF